MAGIPAIKDSDNESLFSENQSGVSVILRRIKATCHCHQ